MSRPDTWFRFYNAAVDNPKVQRLPATLFKVWVNLLCIFSRNGIFPSYEELSFTLRAKPSTVIGWVDQLIAADLIEMSENGLMPHDWQSLQYKSDVSTDRVKRFRQRFKIVSATPDETPPEQSIVIEEPPIVPQGTKYTEAFKVFWEAYPNKVGKDAAWRSWQKRKDRPANVDLLAALETYKRTKPAEREWCNPTTWLNQGRWADAPAAVGASGPGPKSGRTDEQWAWGVRQYVAKRYWPPAYGPCPGEAGCECPPGVLASSGFLIQS